MLHIDHDEKHAGASRHTSRRIHHFVCLVGALSGIAAALAISIAPAHAATVVTDHVISLASRAQSDVPITFGQVFKDGDVPKGATLSATLDGKPITLQVNPKATNPDGSLRHVVLTLQVPDLARRAKLPLALATAATNTASGAAITPAQVLATAYDAKVSIELGGQSYTVDARSLLQAASQQGECKPWNRHCNTWLSGPLVSEWVVNAPATSSSGATAPGLQVYFAVRAYTNGAGGVGQVRSDIIVENTNAFAPQVQPQYTATLTSGSASYTSPALTQYAYTRWHHALWWNDANPQVYLQQNTQYIQDTKAVSRYMQLKPDEKFLESVRQTCAPLDHCDQTRDMADPGAQAAIGPLPRWASVYIVDPDVRAYNWMLANTDALGAYSIHYRDSETGWPVSIVRHPYVTAANWDAARRIARQNSPKGIKYRADLLESCTNNAVVSRCDHPWYATGNTDSWNNAHQPAEGYVAYMVTGSYYYMSELAFGASHNELFVNESYRGFSKGLIDPSHGEVRGKAWTLREMVNAAWLLPDAYPLKAEFNDDVNNSLADWNQKYTNNTQANALGVMQDGFAYSMDGGSHNGIAPWQHNFLTWSVGHAAELGFQDASGFRRWLAKFEIGLMTDWQQNPTQGFCWLEASAYKLQVKDASGQLLPSFTAVYRATFPTLVGLACNSPVMVSAMGKLRKQPWKSGEMSGYAYSATGFPANLQIGLAAAADSGLPDAHAAWDLFESRTVKPSGVHAYDDYPNFAVLPRSTSR